MKHWLPFLLIFFIYPSLLIAQVDDDWDDRTEEEIAADKAAAAFWDDVYEDERKGLYVGLYVGALRSGNATARMYDGHGFDLDGTRHNFQNSWLNTYLNSILSSPAIGGDQVAQALGVDPGQWTFGPEDMPGQMVYNIAFSFGLQARYNFDAKNALLFNINLMRLTTNGLFTVESTATQPQNPANPGAINFVRPIAEFGIRGMEQRMGFQVGYQRILGDHEFFNWIVEGGVDLTIVRFDGNEIELGGQIIDITQVLNTFGQPLMGARNLTGAGVGVFGGFGGQIEAGGAWTIQLLYNPIFQNIALGSVASYGLHHMLGLRMIYNL
ncbi:MAG: hypothetical protein EA392_01890 [Cryomorphaceae bacterium]|nr:MAG: hypothetical protein EA392_01890 [Cryomorphaceae bacterium]